jgi:replication factor C subunit 3/5
MDSRLVPNNLKEYIIHRSIATKLTNFKLENIPNILLHGVCNNGKHTMAKLLINHLYNTNIMNQTSINTHDLKIGNNIVTIEYFSSPYHIEINLYEYGLYDKYIISEFLYNYVKYENITGRLKLIILNHIDKISKPAQYSLRGLLEQYGAQARYICLVNSLAQIDPAVRSRMFSIRIPRPSNTDLKTYLDYVANNIVKLSKSKRNLLLKKKNLFELNYTISSFIKNKKVLELNNYDVMFKKIIKYIEESNIESILKIRLICYNLLLINVNMRTLLDYLVEYYTANKQLSDKLKSSIIEYAGEINVQMCIIEHDIICIEFFILKVKKLFIT